MPAVTNGAELVRRLKETGTPDAKLAPARRALARAFGDENRVASAAEVVAALEAEFGPDHGTPAKARAIAETGRWDPPASAAAVAIEDLLLGAADDKPAGKPEAKPAGKPEAKPAGAK